MRSPEYKENWTEGQEDMADGRWQYRSLQRLDTFSGYKNTYCSISPSRRMRGLAEEIIVREGGGRGRLKGATASY